MASRLAPGTSCWTCRLRHKRCNSAKPVCASCEEVGITCYVNETKPWWMDGGKQQKQMSKSIQGTIKRNAHLRKEMRHFQHEDQGLIVIDSEPTPDMEVASSGRLVAPGRAGNPPGEYITPPDTSLSTTVSSTSGRDPPSATEPSSDSSRSAGWAKPIELELGSVMIYLDHVFPFLFPFYQPSLIETGRQWLLGLLCQNDASLHIAASLSAYFFSVAAQNDKDETHEECRALVRNRLIEEMDKAFKSMQNAVSVISRHEVQSPLLDKIRVMQEIIQLLIVEVTVRKEADWMIHLNPALLLFDEIFKGHGFDHSGPSIAILLGALPSSNPVAAPHSKPLPNTPDQSALMFFATVLLFVDIIASTSLGDPPVLQCYHSNLLLHQDEAGNCIRMETVVGCRNWVLAVIGRISALCAWKRGAKQDGNYSVVSLVDRAAPTLRALEVGLASLNLDVTVSQPKNVRTGQPESYFSRHDGAIDSASIANITGIWAHAASIYLSITLSGWQVSSNDIQTSVAKVLDLLQTVKSPAQLRSLSWPICVAGCLASPSQEDDFRRVVGTMANLGEFGTISNALRIMEAVWDSRNNIDVNSWDIASSLRILGSSALLL